MKYATNYHYDDHSSVPFNLIKLKPSPDGDRNTPAHRHNYYEVFVFSDGGGEHFIDFTKKTVRPLQVHIVPPGSVHLLRRDAETQGYVLLFSREFYFLALSRSEYLRNENILNYRNHYWEVSFDPQGFQHLQERLERLYLEKKSEHAFRQEMICHELNLILYTIMRNVTGLERINEQAGSRILEFPDLVSKHFRKFKQVQQYCSLLNLSPDELNRQCKKTYGKTALKLIQEQLLLESKRLFLHSDLSVKEIAYEIGMEDPNYFSKWIKKMTGTGAKDLRTELRQLYV